MEFEFTAAGQLPVACINTKDTRRLSWIDGVSRQMLLAHEGGRILGALAFGWRRRQLELYLAWVHPRHRENGLAQTLLGLLVEVMRPRQVWAEVVTPRGLAFIRRGQETFPDVRFNVERWVRRPKRWRL